MTRLNIDPFTSDDILFLEEYASVTEPVATAIDVMEGEEHAYLGCVLPTVVRTATLLEDALLTRPLIYCGPLVRALLEGIRERFGPLFEDRECQLAAGFHPRFRLVWLEKHDAAQVGRVRQAMEEAVEECLNDMPASSKSEDAFQEEDPNGTTTLSQTPIEDSCQTGHNNKTKAVDIVENWLAGGPSEKDLVEAFRGQPAVLSKLFVRYNTPLPSSDALERFISQGKETLHRATLLEDNLAVLMFLNCNPHLWKSVE